MVSLILLSAEIAGDVEHFKTNKYTQKTMFSKRAAQIEATKHMHTECGQVPTQAGLVKNARKEWKTEEEIWEGLPEGFKDRAV